MTAIYAGLVGTAAILGLHLAAVEGWHRLIDFHDTHTDRPGPAPIGPRRQPIAALTATPHYEACDELGPWNPSQHEVVPALLAGELTGADR